jgi:hypothetical protein
MENKELTQDQLNEVNARVIQIMETFREGLYNSAAFDYGGYWKLMIENNDHQMSDACKHVYETKERIMSMIDKEVRIVCNDNFSYYHTKRREAKDKIITSMMKILDPALRGKQDHYLYTQRAVNLADFALNTGEELNDYRFNGTLKKKI